MEAAPPGPLGPPPDYEAALASSPAPPPTNPIGPRGAGSFSRDISIIFSSSSKYLDFLIHWSYVSPLSSDIEPPPDYCVAASLPSYEQVRQYFQLLPLLTSSKVNHFVILTSWHLDQAEQLKEKLLAGDVEDQREEPAPSRRSRRNSPWVENE